MQPEITESTIAVWGLRNLMVNEGLRFNGEYRIYDSDEE